MITILIKGYDSIKIDESNVRSSIYNPWIYDLTKPSKASQIPVNTWCWDNILRVVKAKSGVDSIQEYYGGSGRVTVMMQNLFHPSVHIVNDLDRNCAMHLKSIAHKYSGLKVTCEDAYYARNEDVDMVVLDFPMFSLITLYRDVHIYRMLERIRDAKPDYIIITDVSPMKMHLNAVSYAKESRYDIVDQTSYFYAFSDIALDMFGYSISYVVMYHKSAEILLCPGPQGKFDMVDTAATSWDHDFAKIVRK
jgi:hypothetical protein